MRIRKKSWAENELNTNKKLVVNPVELKGRWKSYFGNNNPIHIELGCGKGQFISKMALLNKNINYIAVERQQQIIALALKKSRQVETGNNVAFFNADVNDLTSFFKPKEVERIYINFCDPWPNKKKWAKRRLTHSRFINIYEEVFGEHGEIFFKTDNLILFEFSLNEFANQKNWRLKNISLDLHNSNFEGNVMTEYEEKFSSQGNQIYRLEAYYASGRKNEN